MGRLGFILVNLSTLLGFVISFYDHRLIPIILFGGVSLAFILDPPQNKIFLWRCFAVTVFISEILVTYMLFKK